MSSEKFIFLIFICLVINVDIIWSRPEETTPPGGKDGGDDAKKKDGDDKKQNVLEFIMEDIQKHLETHAPDLTKIYENIASDFEMKRRKRDLEIPIKGLTTEEYVTLKLIDFLHKHKDKQKNKRETARDEVDVEIEHMLLLEKANKERKKNLGSNNPENEPLGGSPRRDSFETDNIPGGGAPFVSNPVGDIAPNTGDSEFGGNQNTATSNPRSDPFDGNTYSRNPNSGDSPDFGGVSNSRTGDIGGNSDYARNGFTNSRNDNFGGNPSSGRDGAFGVDSSGGGSNSESYGGDPFPKNPSFGADPNPERSINTNPGFARNQNPAGKSICNSCSCESKKRENSNLNQQEIPYGQEGRIEVQIVTELPQVEYIKTKNRGKRSFFYPQKTIFDKILADEMTNRAPQQEEEFAFAM